MHFESHVVFVAVVEELFDMPALDVQVVFQEVGFVVIDPAVERQFGDGEHISVRVGECVDAGAPLLLVVDHVDVAGEPSLPGFDIFQVSPVQRMLDALDQVERVLTRH